MNKYVIKIFIFSLIILILLNVKKSILLDIFIILTKYN